MVHERGLEPPLPEREPGPEPGASTHRTRWGREAITLQVVGTNTFARIGVPGGIVVMRQ